MRQFAVVAVLLALIPSRPPLWPGTLPVASPNDNRSPAGTLRDGVLTLSLVATNAMWHPEGDTLPGKATKVFSEEGRAPLAPGPLVRVPVGTEIRLGVRNVTGDTLIFSTPASLHGGGATQWDSLLIFPGERQELRLRASAPGTYVYRARGQDSLSRRLRMTGVLAGAIVVDSAGSASRTTDRILVLLGVADSVGPDGIPVAGRTSFAVNGRSWPHTERLSATVGDTLRWRVINASPEVHPMHLHGFYYRVIESAAFDRGGDQHSHPNRLAVTERMPPFSSMSTAWVPERAGNWLFHCHFQIHIAPLARSNGHLAHTRVENHALSEMRGLVMGVLVSPRPDDSAVAESAPRRRLRVTVEKDSIGTAEFPSMRYVVRDPDTGAQKVGGKPGVSEPLFLSRGEPVAITVVNMLEEPTSVHWHGIELDSYYDGVPGFSGSTGRLSPVIAPRDSFVARFAPPRSGTFMYHSHIDEPRTHQAGLVGALIVREPADNGSDDFVFVIKTARARGGAIVDVNGQQKPDTVVLRVGQPARLRFINLTRANPGATVWVTARRDTARLAVADTLVLQWRPIAKDGADLPESARAPRIGRQIVSMGETYDFEVTPTRPGFLQIEVRAAVGQRTLLNRVPIEVR
jgi:FtsP/CotA-like multicopper oxidase with cupredoxin domain